jgi:Icc protein
MADALNFVHCSDTHIVARGVTLRDVDTCAALERVVDRVNALTPRPRFVLVGGDLASPDLHPDVKRGARDVTDEDYEAAYALLCTVLGRLTVPVHVILGNHDRRVPFRRIVLREPLPEDRRHHYVLDTDGYRICALDSLDAGRNPGWLGEEQVEWLHDRLWEARHRHAIVAVHHHALPVGVQWLDEQMLTDADELWRVVRDAGNVRAVLCGHVHLEHAAVRDGVPLFTTPSTCFQISDQSDDRAYLPGPPAFRVVRCAGARVTSEVVAVR